MPLFLWLHCLTGRTLQSPHRRHIGTRRGNVGRDVSRRGGTPPHATSESLAAQLLGCFTTPSQAALRAELRRQIQDALGAIEPLNREMLALRHCEQLRNAEAAQVLEISEAAASNRHVRAPKRLKKILTDLGG